LTRCFDGKLGRGVNIYAVVWVPTTGKRGDFEVVRWLVGEAAGCMTRAEEFALRGTPGARGRWCLRQKGLGSTKTNEPYQETFV